MRRTLALAAAAVMLLAAAAPVAAATQTRYSVLGSGAWATAYHYLQTGLEGAWIEIGDQMVRQEDGETFLSYVTFEHLREVCGEEGCSLEVTSGTAEFVPFTIDTKKLTRASIDVAVPSMKCVDDGTSVSCSEVVAQVRVTWSGYGPFIRSHGTASGGIAGVYQYTLTGAATERWATVTGSINGFELAPDTNATGALYRTRYAERTIVVG